MAPASRFVAVAHLLAFGQAGFLVGGVVRQPVLPFAFADSAAQAAH